MAETDETPAADTTDPTDDSAEGSVEDSAADGAADGAEVAEIDAERERRLDPENRPENAEVDNSGVTLPTVEEFAEREAEEAGEAEGAAGSADPGAAFRALEYSEEEKAQIEKDREERLDPDNRPPNVEVDNTGRRFEDGAFVDE